MPPFASDRGTERSGLRSSRRWRGRWYRRAVVAIPLPSARSVRVCSDPSDAPGGASPLELVRVVGDPYDAVVEAVLRCADCDQRPEHDPNPAACDESARRRDLAFPGGAGLQDLRQAGVVAHGRAYRREQAVLVSVFELACLAGPEQHQPEGPVERRLSIAHLVRERGVVRQHQPSAPAVLEHLEALDSEDQLLTRTPVRLAPVELGGLRARCHARPRVGLLVLELARCGREREAGDCRTQHHEDEGRASAHHGHARTPLGSRLATSWADRLARALDLYEYQGKELFRRYGIAVSEGRLATTPAEAREAALELGFPVVVKAQVLVGGRGKAGGIKLAESPEEAEARASEILGLDIRGHTVHRIWIEKASEIEREYYLSVTFDRGAKKPLFMFTTQGGIDIEEVAATNPDALVRLHVDPLEGFHPWQARRLVYGASVEDVSGQKQIAAIVEKLYAAFIECDAMLCEINPLIVTPDGEVRALDSKFTVDDNALFRHPDIAEMRDVEAGDPQERLAREKGVTYVKLDGEIGILGNGAGLVMSTLDVIDQVGGRPANFCDLGGGGDAEGVVDALEVIVSDAQVEAILFNIFGGITRCDEVARGILAALEQMTIEHPIVVRLDGTNAEEGRRLLADAAPPNVHVSETLLSAAEQV